ncbi:uncharacterized protein DSM5745_09436 [Aspergillus mulundensis]|uniref:Uncharacterized protein n=1 Tax=Aspergillus mulundensis TaxID=1810919 RepID=A0A3D8QV99_9EURO|nr:hypothetical protein DSM5745_09436 [Aspergillus mulundensis]RDW65697.1 hypothetical protein DSM5745_09436 [Aspergillus mulundensis]
MDTPASMNADSSEPASPPATPTPKPKARAESEPSPLERPSNPPTEYFYHEYRFGPRDIDWSKWGIDLLKFPTVRSDSPAEGDDYDEEEDEDWLSEDEDLEDNCEEEDESWRAEIFEDDCEADGRSDASSVSEYEDEPEDEEEAHSSNLDDQGDDNDGMGRTLTDADVRQLKRFAILTYPGSRFIELPQFKRFLTKVRREQILWILGRHWDLEAASATKVKRVTTFTIQHPDPAKQKIIAAACGNSMEETWDQDPDNDNDNDDENEDDSPFDVLRILRAKDDATLRELVRNTFTQMHAYETLRYFVPGGFGNEAYMAELYGSAVVLGGENGEGFGLDSEDWWERVSSIPGDLPSSEEEVAELQRVW